MHLLFHEVVLSRFADVEDEMVEVVMVFYVGLNVNNDW